MSLSEWFHSLPPEPNIRNTKYNPDNVVRLPKIDRTLANGWKSSEMSEYCRDYMRVMVGDEGYKN